MSSRAPARPLQSRGADRGQVLARVSLPAVADRFLGPSQGAGQRRRWPCPHPDHPAGGTAPAVAVFRGRDGIQRWRCGTCREYGTALDLVMLTQQRDFTEALRLLDDLADGLPHRDPGRGPAAEHPSAATRERIPREALLAQFDLRQLADELLGGGKGRGRSRTWRCPLPQHGPQTGRTPPVTIYTRGDVQRWRCHACGEGGTAIDLVMAARNLSTGEAFSLLLDRLGGRPLAAPRAAPASAPAKRTSPSAQDAIAAHAERCRELLWSDLGLPGRTFLAQRGLREAVLRANGIGYDPGPALLPRPKGLPYQGPAVVLPVLDDRGRAVYLQARFLTPVEGRSYGNVSESLAGPSPRVALHRSPGPERDARVALICEGRMDALSVTQAGYAAAAVLAAGLPDDRVARAILDRYPTRQLVLAFDDDSAGREGAARLARLLVQHGADPTRVAALTPLHCDLNAWLVAAPSIFDARLRDLVDAAPPAIPPESPAPAPSSGRPAVPVDDYTIQVFHLAPDTAEPRVTDHVHVHTFAVSARLLAEEAATQRDPARRGDLPRLAAELAVDVGGTNDADGYREPYASLARDYHARGLRPTGLGDVLFVTAPDGASTSLEWHRGGMQVLSRSVPGAPPGREAYSEAQAALDQLPGEFTVRVLHRLFDPSRDFGTFAHAHTAVVPAPLVLGQQRKERAAGRDLDPPTAAAELVYRLGNDDDRLLATLLTETSIFPPAMASRAPSPGDVFLIDAPDQPTVILRITSDGWERRDHYPPCFKMDPGPGIDGSTTNGPAPSHDAKGQIRAALQQAHGAPPATPELGPGL